MNAKKIMGAVLVALLAAALFIGAGAAAADVNGQTVFVYQPVGDEFKGTWANGANTVTFEAVKYNGNDKYAIIGTDIVEGTYTKGDASIIVKYPTAVITGIAGEGSAAYSFIGGNLYKSDVANAEFTNATGVDNIDAVGYAIIGSNGIPLELTDNNQFADEGEYKIQVVFDANDFITGMPANYIYGAVYTFTVVDDSKATIAADVDSILLGDVVKLTITAKPGAVVVVDETGAFKVLGGQILPTNDEGKVVVPNTGKLTVAVETVSEKAVLGEENTIKVKVGDKDYEVDIMIKKGTITAEAEKPSYFVGEDITIIGTSTAGNVVSYSLKGTNYDSKVIKLADAGITDEDTDAKAFKFVIPTAANLDVGTYTLTLDTGSAKAAVAVVLKQPFITIIEAPEVIVKGDDAEFIINAEAAEGIAYYIFGTNFFYNATENTNVKDEENEDIANQFKVTLNGEAVTAKMDAGQYFMVIQHPMYDKVFNILSFNEAIYLNTTGEATGEAPSTELFKVDKRQTANAAQALCDALDSQNIDDMYVKYSFFVIGEDESFTISEIPSQIAQGTTLTISGVSTSNAGDIVTVEMISTAFAAVPKETVGSAAFIAVTTTVADDGTWEVTFDTSDLNVDEYSLKVAVTGSDDETSTWKNVKINVVEAADEPVTPPTDEPGQDEPGQDEPEAPATPGFGALAALAGLGAVAVLLLRRE